MRVVLMALLILAATPAGAEWVKFNEHELFTFYIDPTTLRKDGSLRKVWELQDLKARHPDGELSRRSLTEYDCKAEQSRILSLSTHSGLLATGNIISSSDTAGTWSYVPPDTLQAIVLRFVCAK